MVSIEHSFCSDHDLTVVRSRSPQCHVEAVSGDRLYAFYLIVLSTRATLAPSKPNHFLPPLLKRYSTSSVSAALHPPTSPSTSLSLPGLGRLPTV